MTFENKINDGWGWGGVRWAGGVVGWNSNSVPTESSCALEGFGCRQSDRLKSHRW